MIKNQGDPSYTREKTAPLGQLTGETALFGGKQALTEPEAEEHREERAQQTRDGALSPSAGVGGCWAVPRGTQGAGYLGRAVLLWP